MITPQAQLAMLEDQKAEAEAANDHETIQKATEQIERLKSHLNGSCKTCHFWNELTTIEFEFKIGICTAAARSLNVIESNQMHGEGGIVYTGEDFKCEHFKP